MTVPMETCARCEATLSEVMATNPCHVRHLSKEMVFFRSSAASWPCSAMA